MENLGCIFCLCKNINVIEGRTGEPCDAVLIFVKFSLASCGCVLSLACIGYVPLNVELYTNHEKIFSKHTQELYPMGP